jgi:hypothetical protein
VQRHAHAHRELPHAAEREGLAHAGSAGNRDEHRPVRS